MHTYAKKEATIIGRAIPDLDINTVEIITKAMNFLIKFHLS